jgi:hypothetical protein
MQKNSITLSIAHNIFLTKEQRYELHEGKKLILVGCALPVWFFKGKTSEPAEEVFCKYILNNQKKEPTLIKFTKQGYKINLPQVPENEVMPTLSDKEWLSMSEKQKSDWYNAHRRKLGSWKLLDFKDGGSKGLNFKVTEVKNLTRQTGIKGLNKTTVVHMVLLRDMEELNESFTG